MDKTRANMCLNLGFNIPKGQILYKINEFLKKMVKYLIFLLNKLKD